MCKDNLFQYWIAVIAWLINPFTVVGATWSPPLNPVLFLQLPLYFMLHMSSNDSISTLKWDLDLRKRVLLLAAWDLLQKKKEEKSPRQVLTWDTKNKDLWMHKRNPQQPNNQSDSFKVTLLKHTNLLSVSQKEKKVSLLSVQIRKQSYKTIWFPRAQSTWWNSHCPHCSFFSKRLFSTVWCARPTAPLSFPLQCWCFVNNQMWKRETGKK